MGKDGAKDNKILYKELKKVMKKHADEGTIEITENNHYKMKCEFDGKPFRATLAISPSSPIGVKLNWKQVRKDLISVGIKPTPKMSMRMEPILTNEEREKEEDFDRFFDLLDKLLDEDERGDI
jgi:hypothetical protein